MCLKTRIGIRRFEGQCWPVNGVMYWFKPVSFLAEIGNLGGGLKYFLLSPLFGEDFQFD